MEFKPVKSPRLYEEVVNQIKELINKGDIKAGDKFPPERHLASEFGVSRGVLREAFRVLENRGLVRSKRGGGRYLRDFNQQNIYNSGNNFINLEKAALLDIAEARKLIETEIVKKATIEANNKDIDKINDLIHSMQEVSDDKYSESDLDLEFHLAIARATHNFALYDLLEAQIQLLIDLEQKHLLNPNKRRELCNEHKKILSAIKKRDKVVAENVMESHIDNLIDAIKEI